MPQTYKEYTVVELSLELHDNLDLASGHERSKEGDIINVRSPHLGTGKAVHKNYLKLLVSGLDKYELGSLSELMEAENGTLYDKRRYCIPLERLKMFYPSLDIGKLKDRNESYQPICMVDEDTNNFFYQGAPLDVHGLVFDKLKMRYL
jgi:hypothetical protein